MFITRRNTLIFAMSAALATFLGFAPVAAQENTVDVARLAEVAVPDRVLGSETAPVTVIEYASPTCPHCTQFHNEVLPAFKEQYVDTGKVRYVLRPFVRNVLDAVIFMLADAAGDDNYHNVINTFFMTANQWGVSETPRDAILAVATQLGFTEESFETALLDQELFDNMEIMREQALEDFGLTGTPTFYINGVQLTGGKTVEELAAVIDPMVPADFQPVVETPVEAPAETGTMDAPAMETPAMESPAMDAPAMDAPAMDAPEQPAQ